PGKLRDSAPSQQHRLHQRRRSDAELCSQPADLADKVGQRISFDQAQRSGALVRCQVSNIVETEVQDGLIPVIITL
ncbi:MAG TPA: hypothetical protein VE400_08885, partial [Mycobacterium sp.]|nr:hypothetical protein [Mycobacterium sp.]